MVRWFFLAGLIACATWRLLTINTSAYRVGDRVEISFDLTTPSYIKFGHEFVRYKDIEIEIPLDSRVDYGWRITTTGILKDRVIQGKKVGFSLIDQQYFNTQPRKNLIASLAAFRRHLDAKINAYLPPSEAGLAIGILLGGSGQISRDYQQAYRRVGLTHVIAASGYNLTLVTVWVVALTGKLISRRKSLFIVVICIISYAIIAGGSASIVRAAIMAVLAVVGLYFGRQSDTKWLLILTGLGMIIYNPTYATDIGFQLSLAATAGLVWWKPQADLSTTVVAQLTTLPIILHHFGTLSIIAPVINLLVVWIVPAVMQIMAAALLMSFIHPLGQLVAYLAWPLLKYFNSVVVFFDAWQFSSVQVPAVSWLWVVGYYLAMLLIYKLLRRGTQKDVTV